MPDDNVCKLDAHRLAVRRAWHSRVWRARPAGGQCVVGRGKRVAADVQAEAVIFGPFGQDDVGKLLAMIAVETAE